MNQDPPGCTAERGLTTALTATALSPAGTSIRMTVNGTVYTVPRLYCTSSFNAQLIDWITFASIAWTRSPIVPAVGQHR